MIGSKYQNRKTLSNLDEKKWDILTFNDVFIDDTRKATKVKKEDYLETGDFPIVDQGKDYIAGYTNLKEEVYDNTPLIIFGDHTRILKYIDFPIFIGADGVKLLKNRFSEKEVLTKYLYYYLCTINIPDTGYNRHFKYLKEIVIPIPDIEMQKRIVQILDKAQELIDKRKAQIEALDQLTQSVFLEMFGDPIYNTKNWETVSFDNVVILQRGYDLPVNKRNLEGNVEVYGSNGVLSFHDEAKVTGGGIITGRSGSIGNVYYTFDDFWPLNTTLFSKETFGNNIIYLKYLLKNFKLERFVNGTGVPTLNRNIVHKEQIINVPIDLQNKFAGTVIDIEKQKEKLENSLSDFDNLFNAFMQRAFKGDLFTEEKVSNL